MIRVTGLSIIFFSIVFPVLASAEVPSSRLANDRFVDVSPKQEGELSKAEKKQQRRLKKALQKAKVGIEPFPAEGPPSESFGPDDFGPSPAPIVGTNENFQNPSSGDSNLPDPPFGDDNGFNIDNIPDPPTDEVQPVTFSLKNIALPEYPGSNSEQTSEKALNFLLNSFSRNPRLVTVDPSAIIDGEITIDGFGQGRERIALDEVFNTAAIQNLLRTRELVNPYACSGDGQNTWRLDWLASVLMVPDFYYQVINFPNQWQTLADELGVENTPPETATQNGNKIWAEYSMISASSKGRMLEFERQIDPQTGRPRFGRLVLRSTDFERNPPPGRRSEESDPALHPNDYRGKAGEMIIDLPNGMQAYYLANNDGTRVGEAPVSIVHNEEGLEGKTFASSHSGLEITAPRDCMRCHRNGPIGQDYLADDFDMDKILEEKVSRGLLSEREAEEAKRRYTTGKVYNREMNQSRKNFTNVLKRAKAFVDDGNGEMAPILADLDAVYRKPLSINQIAKELGIETRELKQRIKQPGNEGLANLMGLTKKNDSYDFSELKLSRTEYEKIFCDLKQGLVNREPLVSSPDTLAPLISQPNHSDDSQGEVTR